MRIGSLFSGYGGLDLAVESVTGAEPAWFVEFDAAPSKILAHHWPDVPNYGDVTKARWEDMPPVDIITGGSPCQDLSAAGKRAGMTEGTRSNLWVNMREAIIHLNPQLVAWENVQGALSAKATSDSDMGQDGRPVGDGGGGHLRALGRVLGDLAEIGYDAEWTTIRASDVGAPHHRARVFLIGYPQEVPDSEDDGRDELYDSAVRNEACSGRFREPPGGDRCKTSADAHVLGSQAGHERPVGSGTEVPVTDGGGETLPNPDGERRHGRDSGKGEAGRGQPTDDSGVRIEWGQYAPAVRRWERITRPAPAPTELNTRGNPRLSAPFAEWMMGLPAGWVTDVPGLSRADQLKAIGNGVCPQQAEAALRQLLGRISSARRKSLPA